MRDCRRRVVSVITCRRTSEESRVEASLTCGYDAVRSVRDSIRCAVVQWWRMNLSGVSTAGLKA